MACERPEEVGHRAHVLHHRVVEHHADRPARPRRAPAKRASSSSGDRRATSRWTGSSASEPERLGAVLAREHREPELDAARAPVSRVQRFHGGVKNGSSRSPSSSRRRSRPARDVRALLVERAARAELALAPLALVVGVRVAVLVQAEPVARAQLAPRAAR